MPRFSCASLIMLLALAGCSSGDPVSPAVDVSVPAKVEPPPRVTHTLRHQFTKGTVEHRMSTINIKQLAGGIEVPIDITHYSQWTTEEVLEDGSGRLSYSVPRVVFKMAAPAGGVVRYDSDDGEEPDSPLWAQLKPEAEFRLKTKFSCVVSPTGDVSDVNIPGDVREMMKKNVGTASSDPVEYLTADTRSYFVSYPAEPVAIGDTWNSETKLSQLGGTFETKTVRTLGEVKSDSDPSTVVISGALTQKSEFPADATFLIRVVPGATEELEVELKSGRLVKKVTRQATEMVIKVMGIEQTIKRNVEMTIVPYVAPADKPEAGN